MSILFFLSLFLCQCSKENLLEWALNQAGENRKELESVLFHYTIEEPDSLKYQTALFLITNMPGHYSYQGDEILNYYKEIVPVLDSHANIQEKKESIEKIADRYPGLQQNTIEDSKVITAEYVIRNIDQAF
ncbi:MAG: hypothetical protein LUD15_00280 [Bacteroides sp.]|nr:hypothetical protein [Bacteroides sp.]